MIGYVSYGGSLVILILILVLSIYFPSSRRTYQVQDLYEKQQQQLTKIRSKVTKTEIILNEEEDNKNILPNDDKDINTKMAGKTTTSINNNRTKSIAWLLSFPNSGTTYTLKFIQSITNTTTATNYGGTEQVGYKPSIPLFSEGGPYLRYPDRPIPSNPAIPIVTKSHCDSNTIRISFQDFIISCRSGNQALENGTVISSIYKIHRGISRRRNTTTGSQDHTTIPKDIIPLAKIIHLIRNPFDNIVARLHYQRKHWENQIHRLQHQLQNITGTNSNNDTLITGNSSGPKDEKDDVDDEVGENEMTFSEGNTTATDRQQQVQHVRSIQEEIRYTQKKLEIFNDTRTGLISWCNWLDKTSLHNLQHTLQDLRPPPLSNGNANITTTTTTTTIGNITSIPSWYQRWEQFRENNNGKMPPCICEFYRYIQWHNNVVRLTMISNKSSSKEKSSSSSSRKAIDWLRTIPLLHLYYENYTTPNLVNNTDNNNDITDTTNSETTTTLVDNTMTRQLSKSGNELVQFLQLNLQSDSPGPVPIFYEGKQYSQTHYTLRDRIELGQIAKSYLLPETWELIHHYFPSS